MLTAESEHLSQECAWVGSRTPGGRWTQSIHLQRTPTVPLFKVLQVFYNMIRQSKHQNMSWTVSTSRGVALWNSLPWPRCVFEQGAGRAGGQVENSQHVSDWQQTHKEYFIQFKSSFFFFFCRNSFLSRDQVFSTWWKSVMKALLLQRIMTRCLRAKFPPKSPKSFWTLRLVLSEGIWKLGGKPHENKLRTSILLSGRFKYHQQVSRY